jgi:phosphate transport system substrate-binding protein
MSREDLMLVRLVVLLVVAISIPSMPATLGPACAANLQVGGTGAATEMLRQIGPAFEAETGIVLQVIPSLGTGGANSALADGVLGLSIGGRDLKAKEAERGLKVVTTLRTPFGLATSRPTPEVLKSAELVNIYRADRPAWPDGTPIRIVLRPTEESDNALLGDLFPGMSEAIKQARTRNDLSVAATDQDNAEMAEKTQGSLVGASLAQIVTERRNLRFVAIDGVAPSLDSYLSGAYPYAKTLYVVAPSKISREAAGFLKFIATPAGKAALREAAIVPGAE